MTGINRWVLAVGIVGTAAMLAAAGLLWIVLTRPVALADFVQRTF
jgi:hypothetical protein